MQEIEHVNDAWVRDLRQGSAFFKETTHTRTVKRLLFGSGNNPVATRGAARQGAR